jgi:Tol biopolymer transport system component
VWYLDGSVQPINGNTLRVSVNGAEPKEITAPIRLPLGQLSPDDKLLYRPLSRDPQHDDIEVIEVATGERKQLLTVPGRVRAGALSPDGKILSVVVSGKGGWGLSRIAVDGSGYRELYSGVDPRALAWTRDGRSILFIKGDESQIMRIPAEGGQPESTGISAPFLRAFDLSPNGSRIAYGVESPLAEVWVLDNVLAALK